MCVCVCVCVCVCMCVYVCVVCVCVCVCVCACAHVCVYVCRCVYLCVFVHDTVIIGILSSLATTSRLQQNVCCIQSLMLGLLSAVYSNLPDMTTSITEISEVTVQLLEWWVTLHLCIYI